MGFSNKRGRPKKVANGKQEVDLGTVELQKKRRRNLTAEPIDICLDKRIIDDEQHSAALHFRWLYTVKFGAAGVSAVDLNGLHGREIKSYDEAWLAERNVEYGLAIIRLREVGCLKVIMNIVIFNHRPRFLYIPKLSDRVQIKKNAEELAQLREGLDVLLKLNKRNIKRIKIN